MEKIIDYVNETPYNTNIGILKDKLRKYSNELMSDAVKSVNGNKPDDMGNVEIEIPEGFSGKWDDLEGKPFYDERVEYVDKYEPTEYSVPLDYAGYPTYDYNYGDLYYVGGEPLEEGVKYKIEHEGGVTDSVIFSYHDGDGNEQVNYYKHGVDGLAIYSVRDTQYQLKHERAEITLPYIGVYVATKGAKVVSIYAGEIEKLDAKFLPDECGSLFSAKLKESLQLEIPANAYKLRSDITYAYFPLAKTVGEAAFNSCFELSTVDCPSATKVEFEAFWMCENLKEVNMPLVTEIGPVAFANSGIRAADFPLLTTISDTPRDYKSPFYNCRSLERVNLPALTTLRGSCFEGCVSLQRVNLPLVTCIESRTFQGCGNLTTLDFPSVTSLEGYALSGCYGLTALVLRSASLVTVSSSSALTGLYRFSGKTHSIYNPEGLNDGYFYVPAALVDTYKVTDVWSEYATKFRALEDFTVDGTLTGPLDEAKIAAANAAVEAAE